MFQNYLKKILPKSLFARLLVIIVSPILIAQIIATYIFYERHWESVSSHMISSLAGEISIIADLYENNNSDIERKITDVMSKRLYLKVKHFPDLTLIDLNQTKQDIETKRIAKSIREYIKKDFFLRSINSNSDILMSLQLNNGILEIIFSAKRVSNPTTYIFILWMTGSTFILISISIILMNNQIKSIEKLALAAEKFGKGINVKFKPSGASEVRKAGKAFIEMKQRIARQIKQRTEMLAGVSHDIKTPLTRMKLQLAMMTKNEEVESLSEDVNLMQKMIKDYLEFAKNEHSERNKIVNLGDFLNKIILSFNADNKIQLEITDNVRISIKELHMRRAISNVIENALKYGKKSKISLSSQDNLALIKIEDNGPGIAKEDYKKVFKPFYRIDKSRNIDEGGVGLGLAITKDVITKHGGTIELAKSKMGGLLLKIELPI